MPPAFKYNSCIFFAIGMLRAMCLCWLGSMRIGLSTKMLLNRLSVNVSKPQCISCRKWVKVDPQLVKLVTWLWGVKMLCGFYLCIIAIACTAGRRRCGCISISVLGRGMLSLDVTELILFLEISNISYCALKRGKIALDFWIFRNVSTGKDYIVDYKHVLFYTLLKTIYFSKLQGHQWGRQTEKSDMFIEVRFSCSL